MIIREKSRAVSFVAVFLVAACLLPAGAMQSERADEVFSFANQLMRDRLYEAAAQQFLQFATGNPRDPRAPEALEKAAQCLSRAGSVDEAVKVLETLIDTYSDTADLCAAKVRLGRLYYNEGRYTDADRMFGDVVALRADCPLYPDALLGKGEALIPLEKYSAAADLFSAIIQHHHDSQVTSRAYFDLAFCQRRLEKDKEALETYSELARTFPKDPIGAFASIEAAEIQTSLGDSLAAIELYSAARQFHEKAIFVPATLKGALLLEGVGDHQRALAWYREVLALDDLGDSDADLRDVFGRAARAAYHAGDYGATADFSKALSKRFEGAFAPEAAYYTALAELKRGDFTRAMEIAGVLELRAPGSRWAIESPRIRGKALAGTGKPREAVSELRRFVSSTPDSAAKCDALEMIADVFVGAIGDTGAAVDAMLQKLEVEKNRYPDDLFETARLFERVGKYDEAAAMYEEIIDGFPLSPEADVADARLSFIREFTLRDPLEALESMSAVAYEITSLDPNSARLRLAQARLEITRDPKGALEILSVIIPPLKGSALYPKAVYLEGACYANLAKRARLLDDADTVREALDGAMTSWEELTKRYANSEWAGQAAADRVLVMAEVDGEVDTTAIFRVLSRHPKLTARASLLALLGDHYSRSGSTAASKRALTYYQQAVTLAGDDGPAELILKLAGALSGAGRDAEARELYEPLAAHEEKRIRLQATYGMGKALRRLKRYEEAHSYFLDAGSEAVGNLRARALLQAADCRYLLRSYEEALLAYRGVGSITTDPGLRWEVTFRIGMCLRRTGRLREALGAMETCIHLPGGGRPRSRAYTQAVEIARQLGDPEAERRLLSAFAQEFQEGEAAISARRHLVRLHLREGDPEAGLALTEDLIRRKAEAEDEDVALRVMALFRIGRIEDARKRLSSLEEKLGPDDALLKEIAVEKAKYHYDAKDYKSAAAAVAGLARHCSGDSTCEEGMYIYCLSLIAQDKVEDGTREARRFFQLFPVSGFVPRLHLKLGNVLSLKYQRHNEALMHYREAAAAAKDSSVAFDALKHAAVALQTLSQWDEAGELWAEVLDRFPRSTYAKEAALNVARCKMESGNYPGAIAAYGDALPLLDGGDRARAYYWTGVCYQTLGDCQSAVVEYLKVPYLLPSEAMWAVTAQLKAAECYTLIGRYDSAREIYNRVVHRFGAASNWGKVAQKALAELEDAASEEGKGGDREK